METVDNVVLTKWYDIKAQIEALEVDIHKNAMGVIAAGVRVRKGLRGVRKSIVELTKTTIDTDKSNKAAKPPREKDEKAA